MALLSKQNLTNKDEAENPDFPVASSFSLAFPLGFN
ncbi:hypothetical protein SGGBAA2069_c16560 [Streptococcus gallolyticus subsp. gallolyticus ATCC BAA-2069]|nr:hypothetical protein SGGBAA2069_c16560 [Streptococcus gallolyticus subsp. gallolyticus ATCC BAA-2069]